MDGENSSLFSQISPDAAAASRERWQSEAQAARAEEDAEYEDDGDEYESSFVDYDSSYADDGEEEDASDDDAMDDSQDASGITDDQGSGGDATEATEVPDVTAAMTDPLFVAMANHMLAAAGAINEGSGQIVNRDAFEELQTWVWENLWLPRVGFGDNDYSDTSEGGYQATPLPMPTPQQ